MADRTATTFLVHAWVPELGPPPLVTTATERELVHAASLVLDGRFRSAAAVLDRSLPAGATPRDRLLVALFRHHTLLRRYRYLGGALYLTADVALDGGFEMHMPLYHQAQAAVNALPPRERVDGMAAAEWSAVLAVMLDIPAMLRQRAFSNPSDYGQAVQSLDGALGMARQRFDAATQASAARHLLSSRDVTVLRHLLAGNELRARRDIAAARREFDAAIASATPAGAAELRIDRGDVLFRYGDALTLGHDGALAVLLVTGILTQADLGWTALPDGELEQSLSDWAAAEKVLGPVPRLVVRRGASSFSRDPEAALRQLHEAARGEGIGVWAAEAAYALYEGSRPRLLEAVARARAEDNIGAAASFAEAARIEAAFAGLLGNTPRASALLEAAADAHGDAAPRMRAETLAQLAMYYNSIGRPDAAIVACKAAADAHQKFVARATPFVARFPPGRAPIDLAFERRFAGRIELALGAAYAARSLATGSASAAALAEKSLAAADAAFRDNPAAGEDASMMAANAIAQSINFAIDRARRNRWPCGEMRQLYNNLRARAESAGMTDLVMLLDLSLPECDTSRLEEHRRRLEQHDLVAPLRTKVAASGTPIGMRPVAERIEINKTVVTLQIQMDVLSSARAWTALERTADAFAKLTRDNLSLQSLHPYSQAQRMSALNGQGRHVEALRIQEDLHRNWWGVMVPQLRAGVLLIAAAAQASLCATGDAACDPVGGLLAVERIWFEERKAAMLRTGVQPLRRATAERAALEARLASGGPLTDADVARLAELRGDSSEAILREPEPSRASVEQVVAALPHATRLIVLFPAPERLLVWHGRRGNLRLSSVAVKPWEVAAAAQAVEYAVTDRVEEAIDGAAAEASAWLQLLDPPPAAGETLAIVASGALARMPFDVLSVSGRRLAGEQPIVYADHLGSIADRGGTRPDSGSVFVAGVNGNGLQTAEAEAVAIAGILGGSAIIGAEVTADRVRERLPGARIIHFALHATLISDNPYESYLSFGAGGRLRAWELFRAAPAAELITLSACDTGAEAVRRNVPGWFGTAPTSLVSFAFAGNARYIVASFWRLKDSVGTRMMQDFYRFLAAGDPPAVAMQRTKRSMIAEGKPAYYYATFFVAARSIGALTGPPTEEPR